MRHVPATNEKTAWRLEASAAPAAQMSRYASSTWLGSAKRFLREKDPRKDLRRAKRKSAAPGVRVLGC